MNRIPTQELANVVAAGAGTFYSYISLLQSKGPMYNFVMQTLTNDVGGGDTLDVYVDFSPDGHDVPAASALWINAVHFPQKLGTDAANAYQMATHLAINAIKDDVSADLAANGVRPGMLMRRCRLRYVVVGGTAAFTFKVWAAPV